MKRAGTELKKRADSRSTEEVRRSVASRRRGRVYGLTVSLLVGGLMSAAFGLGWLTPFELTSLDARFQLRGAQPLDSRVVVIDIDEETLGAFGFPLPRLLFASMLKILHDRGAKAVGFDIYLVEEGEASGADALRDAVRDYPIAVFPSEYTAVRGEVTLGAEPFQGLRNARARTHVFLKNDEDGVHRVLPLVVGKGQEQALALAARTVAMGTGAKISTDPFHIEGLPDLPAGNELQINFRDVSGTHLKALTLHDLMLTDLRAKAGKRKPEDKDLDQLLNGAIVFVGQSAASVGDHGATPLSTLTPLVLAHVNAADNFLTGGFLRETSLPLSCIFILLLALLVGAVVTYARTIVIAIAGTVVVLGVWLAIAFVAFLGGGVVPVVGPCLAALVAASAVSFVNHWVRDVDERVARRAFQRFVAPHILDRILEEPDRLDVSGHQVPLTILFSDIKGYTALSNALPPDEILNLLSDYLDRMVKEILVEEGTIDKIMGDGIMCFYGDPLPQEDHALRAIRTALAMQKAADKLADDWGDQGRAPLRVRIGIASGEVYVGNIGSAEHLEYTVIGRPVNLASRLESKAPPGSILISRETKEAVGDAVLTEPFGGLDLKGYSAAYDAYLVVGIAGSDERRPKEQRGTARIPMLTEVEFSFAGVTFKARSSDLSPGGMFVISEEIPPEDADVIIRAAILSPSKAHVTCRGVVSHIREAKEGARGFGVMFTAIEAENREAVKAILAHVLGERAEDDQIQSVDDGKRFEAQLG